VSAVLSFIFVDFGVGLGLVVGVGFLAFGQSGVRVGQRKEFGGNQELEYGNDANGSIGQGWKAGWAFLLIGTVFLFWMMIMSYNVYRGD
jgi:hypothetical protein